MLRRNPRKKMKRFLPRPHQNPLPPPNIKERISNPQLLKATNAFSPLFLTKQSESLMHALDTREFISERNIDLESFRPLGVSKIIIDIGWRQTVCDVKEYVPSIVREFYANLSEDVDSEGKPEFQKVFVRGHVYDFSSKIICDYLKILLYDFQKDYDMNVIAFELLGMGIKWPRKKTLKVFNLTLKYASLHKEAMSNWWPTSHYPIGSLLLTTLLF